MTEPSQEKMFEPGASVNKKPDCKVELDIYGGGS